MDEARRRSSLYINTDADNPTTRGPTTCNSRDLDLGFAVHIHVPADARAVSSPRSLNLRVASCRTQAISSFNFYETAPPAIVTKSGALRTRQDESIPRRKLERRLLRHECRKSACCLISPRVFKPLSPALVFKRKSYGVSKTTA
jgi:hypothetical protein